MSIDSKKRRDLSEFVYCRDRLSNLRKEISVLERNLNKAYALEREILDRTSLVYLETLKHIHELEMELVRLTADKEAEKEIEELTKEKEN